VPSVTAKHIHAVLQGLADPLIAAHSQKFFKTGEGEYGEGDRFLGIRVPVIRQQVRKHPDIVLAEIQRLLRSAFHEERLFALLSLANRFAEADNKTQAQIYRLYIGNVEYVNNWDLVDSSAPHIVGAYLEDKDRGILCTLAASEILWERRIAVMASFHFIRLHQFDDFLGLAAGLLRDKEDLIHKAVGWMLREVGKRDLAAEQQFLNRHYREMPRTMLRYAIEKFPQAQRRQYLRGDTAGPGLVASV
jgi:3-methyladenine DNA glycosylase AlkD